jgi:uncharacterized protein (TIGR00369 family)
VDSPQDWHEFGSNPVDDWLGTAWELVTAERVVARVDLGDAHHQPYGLVHGGVWCAIVESVASFGAGARAQADGLHVVGVNNDTDFLRAHRSGPVTAVGTPIHVGRTQQLWEVVISRDDDDQVVARGKVRLANVPTDRFAG